MNKRFDIIKRQLSLCTVLLFIFAIPISHAYNREAEIKAAYLFRLSLFIEWPEVKIDRSADLKLCIAEDMAFYDVVVDIIGGKRINNKELNIFLVNSGYDITECHILFVPEKTKDVNSYLSLVSNHPILTVGENKEFYRNDGIIYLFKKQDRIKFAINTTEVEKAHLKIRAQLLKLASEPEED